MRTLVITPTLNERLSIKRHVKNVMQQVDELLIVDDHSIDGTIECVKELQNVFPNRLHLIVRNHTKGLGASYNDGIRWALSQPKFDCIVQMDADGQHQWQDIKRLTEQLDFVDLAIGTRTQFVKSKPFIYELRRLLSWLARLSSRNVMGLHYADPTSGFMAWRTNALRQVMTTNPSLNGYVFVVELKCKAQDLSLIFCEVPIEFDVRLQDKSKVNLAVAIQWLVESSRVRAQTFTGRGIKV